MVACNDGASKDGEKAAVDTSATPAEDTSHHHMAENSGAVPLLPIPDSAKVFFVNLKDGQKIKSPFKVKMGVSGIALDSAGVLKPASGHHHILIDAGDSLTAGQVIANLGNTGNTDAPHLHFHVMSTPDPLRSNGLPFVFKDFTLDGRLASMNALDPLLAGQPAPMEPGTTPRAEKALSPLVLDVMTYAAG
jgi:hypothetical protein